MNAILKTSLVAVTILVFACTNPSTSGLPVSFYQVPLVCGAAPEIGCGSRIKPFFTDTEKEKKIKESWTNRQGTIIAIVWADELKDEKEREALIQPLFKKHHIEAELVNEEKEIADQNASFKKDKWYKGMDVDLLSEEEAGTIADNMISFAKEKSLVTTSQADSLRTEIESYFKAELVKVRSEEELNAESTRNKWRKEVGLFAEKYIGKEKTAEFVEAYQKYREENETESCCKEKNACCKKPETANVSTITCPNCGTKKTQSMPTDVCQLYYKCEQCNHEMRPKKGDCCVFCSYGDHKCPSKQ